ncbi:MAG TPA: TIGR01777 family oxidoreductase [Candidatus Binatia bacterium]|nr:TIGR01777 family oxidoreductase [Candidatus Binatia bacterium]
MIIAVTGSSGLVGSALVSSLQADGHRVIPLVRREPRPGEDALRWHPSSGAITPAGPAIADALVHLAGESIAGVRWTAGKKRRIRESRTSATRLLTQTLTRLAKPPAVLVCASGIGYYGSRGDEVLSEESRPGTGFLADVGREWEAATATAIAGGLRVVNLRLGIVLSAAGGALAKMLTPFRLGLGGVIGDGAQWMSWIALDDVIGAIRHVLATDALRGPVNAVAPTPVTNAEFTRTLGRVLGRPTLVPLPAFAARLALGEMADELLLSSQRVVSARLQASGYTFRHSTLEGALRSALGRI